MNARACASVKWSRDILGTSVQPSRWAASIRPCPAITFLLRSISTGTLKRKEYERGTALSKQVVIGQVPFSRYFLEKKLRLREPTHKTLLVIEAAWDLYRIARGDLVLIDRSQATFPPDDVYLLDFPGMELRGTLCVPRR
jgi:hypothetical protein